MSDTPRRLRAGSGRPQRGFGRARCDGCGLPAPLCLCGAHPPLDAQTQVLVVLPAAEARSTSNTARLLRLWLPEQVTLHVLGESAGPLRHALPPKGELLFPTAGARALDEPAPARLGGAPPPRALARPGEPEPLIVPDGTWAQAQRLRRRILTTAARPLPEVRLTRPWPSAYTLRRKARGPCTLEAVAIALALRGDAAAALALLERFAGWVRAGQAVRRGAASEATAALSAPHPAASALRAASQPIASALEVSANQLEEQVEPVRQARRPGL